MNVVGLSKCKPFLLLVNYAMTPLTRVKLKKGFQAMWDMFIYSLITPT